MKIRIVKPGGTAVARQWLSSDHVVTPTDTNATMEYLWQDVFSTLSMPMLYKADKVPERISGREPQGTWRQEKLIGGKLPVIK
jgi:hypothetical protein